MVLEPAMRACDRSTNHVKSWNKNRNGFCTRSIKGSLNMRHYYQMNSGLRFGRIILYVNIYKRVTIEPAPRTVLVRLEITLRFNLALVVHSTNYHWSVLSLHGFRGASITHTAITNV